MNRVTASKTGLLLTCPASHAQPWPRSEFTAPVARRGNAAHGLVQAHLLGRPLPIPDDDEDLAGYLRGFDLDAFAVLGAGDLSCEWATGVNPFTGAAAYLGCDIGRAYPDLGPAWVWGSADFVVRHADGTATVADLKTGFVPVEPAAVNAQLRTLMLALELWGMGATSYRALVIKAFEDGSFDCDEARFAPAAVRAFRWELKRAMTIAALAPSTNYVDGKKCIFCPAKPVCPEWDPELIWSA